MSDHYSRALELEEVFGPPQAGEPSPDDPRFHGIQLPAQEDNTPRQTFEARAQAFIAEGLCPVCKVPAPVMCDICGWELALDRSRAGAGEGRRAVSPRQPELVDEYAPAVVEDEAA